MSKDFAKFSQRLDRSKQLFLRFGGETTDRILLEDNPYFELFDNTTLSDLDRNTFRYLIVPKKSWGKLDLQFKFSHPDNIRELYGCSAFDLKRLDDLDNKKFLSSYIHADTQLMFWRYVWYFWPWVMIFLKLLVIFKYSLSKKYRSKVKSFWLVRSIWSMQIAYYFCFVSTNTKGIITRVFEAIVAGLYRLGPHRLEIKFDQEVEKAAFDVYMGSFTTYGFTAFFLSQHFVPALLYIILFMTSLLPLSKFKQVLAPLRLSILCCYHIPFTIYSITTYANRSSKPSTFDLKYSFAFAVIVNVMSFIDFFGLLLTRDTALKAFKITSGQDNILDKRPKSKSFYFYGNCEFDMLGFGLENRILNRFKKFKMKKAVKQQMEDAGVSFRGSGVTARSTAQFRDEQ